MTIDEVALRVSEALSFAHVPFMLVGGFSSNYYGIPRSTKDAGLRRAIQRSPERFIRTSAWARLQGGPSDLVRDEYRYSAAGVFG